MFSACGAHSLKGDHYDTTRVDTMVAINLDSVKVQDGTVVSDWQYSTDSVIAKLSSMPQKKSNITPNNHLFVRVAYRNHRLDNLCLILGDGERFAGNSYDTTNVIKFYAHGKMLGKFTYKPGISKQTDSAFINNASAFLPCIKENRSFKLETTTFTSGKLVYEFNMLRELKVK